MVATVFDELRTPITSIRGFIEFLLYVQSELTESQVRTLTHHRPQFRTSRVVAEDLLSDPGAGRGLKVAFLELDLYQLADEAGHAIQTSARVAGVES